MEKQKNVPELRFPEFEGEWERKKFGEIATNRSGKYNPEKEINSIKCIELEHLASETAQLLGYVDGKNSGSIKNKFDSGDVLFGKLRPYLKKYLLAPFEGVCSSEIWVLKGTKILNEFLFRIVQTNNFIDLANQSSGSKMPRADWSVVENGLFSFPTLPEQSKIATFLTAVDEKLQALKKKKSLLEVYKKGVMQKLFSQELRFKNEDGKEFGDWEEKKLGEVCEINPSNKTLPERFIYIDLESVSNGILLKENEIQNKEAPSRAQRVLLQNDILFQMVRPYQMNNLYFNKNGNYVASTGYAQIRTKQNSMYIYQYLHFQKFVDKVIERCTGTSYPAINSTDLSNIEIILPSLKEQTLIANFLTSLDEKINHTQTEITKTEVWKKGLLQKMFV